MNKKILKIIVYQFVMILSPLALVGVAGAVIILSFWANGETTASAFGYLSSLFRTVYPFLPYLTGIPAALIVGMVIVKKPETITKFFRNL